ncbi:uncharacterized protein LOC129756229 [Uranotaenia lowii]|uniref:uncharacterized protein LOC129756229 n=1 Tax=Uranotaenia lowii TaxID=190385 RepID=UPI002479BBD5|nr:uncharacterized protein LOC129756229 [Uranotaenia lowii]
MIIGSFYTSDRYKSFMADFSQVADSLRRYGARLDLGKVWCLHNWNLGIATFIVTNFIIIDFIKKHFWKAMISICCDISPTILTILFLSQYFGGLTLISEALRCTNCLLRTTHRGTNVCTKQLECLLHTQRITAEIASEVLKSFGFVLFVELFSIITASITGLYESYLVYEGGSDSMKSQSMHLTLQAVWIALHLYKSVVILYTQSLLKNEIKQMELILCQYSSKETFILMEKFSDQLLLQENMFKAWRIIELDLSFYAVLGGLTATYVIVLIQLN